MADARRKILKSLEARFEKGQVVFEEGEQTRDLYILLDGEVEVRKGDRVMAVIREPDSYIGEMSLLLGTPRTATLVARKDCRMIRVPEAKVTDFFAHSPALGIKLARVLAMRLQEMNVKYERMLEQDAPGGAAAKGLFLRLTAAREARAFLELYCQCVGTTMTMGEIVNHLDMPLPQLDRMLTIFKKAGLIVTNAREISFVEAPNKALRHLILNWTPPQGT